VTSPTPAIGSPLSRCAPDRRARDDEWRAGHAAGANTSVKAYRTDIEATVPDRHLKVILYLAEAIAQRWRPTCCSRWLTQMSGRWPVFEGLERFRRAGGIVTRLPGKSACLSACQRSSAGLTTLRESRSQALVFRNSLTEFRILGSSSRRSVIQPSLRGTLRRNQAEAVAHNNLTQSVLSKYKQDECRPTQLSIKPQAKACRTLQPKNGHRRGTD